jgi:hypothetical protein
MADPISASLILGGIGAGVSAIGTIAGGQSANAMGQSQQNQWNYQADQLKENASSEIGAAQRQMLDTQQKTRLAESTVVATSAGSGFTAGVGSPGAIEGSIAQRGSYEAAMQLWNGQNAATGDLNKAQGDVMSGTIAAEGGQIQQQAADFSAVGNLASAGGTMFGNYAKLTNPTNVGSATSYG